MNAGHPAGFQAAAESRRQTQLAAISEVSKAITSILDQEKLLDEVVSLIHKRFGFPYVHLFTVQYGPRKIVYAAGSGRRSSTIDQQGLEYDIDDPQGLIPWVVLHGATRLVNDVTQEQLYRPSPLPPHDTRSELTIPLLFGGQVLGVLDLQSDAPGAFDEEDRFLLETLAENVSIALRNAQLYRSEVWRRQVAESMREVVGLLSADIDLDTVLNRILVELEKALPLDLAAIWLVDEEELDDRAPQPASLHLAAVHGASLASLEGELSSAPPLAWLVEALDAGHPVLRTAGSPFDPLAAVLDFPPGHSAVAAPLKVGEISFGVLTLAHRSAGRYGAEASAMAGTFASYAAVAIENTRLYEDAHEQAWVSTVLLQVTEATQALTDLNELLNTVTQITPQLTGVKACSLYITDEEGVFLPAAASGLDERQQAEFSRGRFAPGDVRALDQMADLKQARILQWDEDNLRLTRIYHPPGPGNQPLEPELVVLVPLLAHGDVLGALLVEYQPETIDGNPLRSLDSFLDERLAVIQGIAHQTATAVENIRLVRAQREEAYASIALLQVAQAVVGSADLAEALGAVVRITPILVGVNRAVVFLSDQSGKGFRSIAAYGASREAVVYEYASGEFPLLDAVSEADSLVVYPLRSGEDIFKDVPDDWSFLIPPDSEEIADFLVYADRLLLACPLSVKGQVLGVLLVEEPELVIADAFSLRSNRRLRDKRLEILRGVSQQAALAIQNDILQRETVDRERLEREFQLARQIQRTFLPATIPNLEGWDLRVCWRTAREVGGDFYDFFELPGGRFGLVIADVADKGMPAALFMTVVRSLVRAAIHQADSPAKVLELVNHLIVPDATQGMFITLAYAVLDLESGSMDYANAGHNPPLVVRERTCAIERFTRGGMALGVLEDNPIQGGGTQLGPGDYLVMYTDGVTEAFSPMGEIYGEDKLYATVAGAAACSDPHLNNDAQYLLEAIDQDVSEFIADAPRSDDLTLMVLRRLR